MDIVVNHHVDDTTATVVRSASTTWLLAVLVLVVVTIGPRVARAGVPTPPGETTAVAVAICSADREGASAEAMRVCLRWIAYCGIVPSNPTCVALGGTGNADALQLWTWADEWTDREMEELKVDCSRYSPGGSAAERNRKICEHYRPWCNLAFIPSPKVGLICYSLLGSGGEMAAPYVQRPVTQQYDAQGKPIEDTPAAVVPVQTEVRPVEPAGMSTQSIDQALEGVRPAARGLFVDSPPSKGPSAGELFGETIAALFRYTSVTGRILGAGSFDDSDGATGNGFTVGVTRETVAGRHHVGYVAALEAEVGSYRDAGKIGSIGVDVGPAIHSSWGYLGASVGLHWTASPYQSAGLVPVLAHVALMTGGWGIYVVGGYGWRPDLPDDGSPASLITYQGRYGLNSSQFRLTIRRRRVQVGFGVQDLDGDMIGSLHLAFGGGLMGANPRKAAP